MAETFRQILKRNIWQENQVVRQILGICSSLAVTNLMANSLVMGAWNSCGSCSMMSSARSSKLCRGLPVKRWMADSTSLMRGIWLRSC